jgi:hypothetical protein
MVPCYQLLQQEHCGPSWIFGTKTRWHLHSVSLMYCKLGRNLQSALSSFIPDWHTTNCWGVPRLIIYYWLQRDWHPSERLQRRRETFRFNPAAIDIPAALYLIICMGRFVAAFVSYKDIWHQWSLCVKKPRLRIFSTLDAILIVNRCLIFLTTSLFSFLSFPRILSLSSLSHSNKNLSVPLLEEPWQATGRVLIPLLSMLHLQYWLRASGSIWGKILLYQYRFVPRQSALCKFCCKMFSYGDQVNWSRTDNLPRLVKDPAQGMFRSLFHHRRYVSAWVFKLGLNRPYSK